MDNNLLSGLEAVGLENLANINLFEDEEETGKKPEKQTEQEVKEEKDYLFEKTYTCPVCDNVFKCKTVKTGKNKLLTVEPDLRPKYKDVDSIKYDAIVCDKCGYAALSKSFGPMGSVQANLIRTNITPTFKGVNNDVSEYSYDDAILRHQLALLSSAIKKGPDSEKAYICLKLAWLLRGKGENLDKNSSDYDGAIKKIAHDEQEFIQKAYQGFVTAMSKERFPICGMDDMQYIYLCAELARKCKDYPTAAKLVSEVIVSKTAGTSLKNKARDLYDSLKKEINPK
jgi:uncharacterized protein (DUF2225 family)